MKKPKPSLRVSVETLPQEGMDMTVDFPAAHFPLLRQMTSEGECRFDGTVSVSARLTHREQMVAVTGSAETAAGMRCGRCLGGYEASVSASFSLLYSPRPDTDTEARSEIVHVDGDELGLYFFDGDEIDLTDAVQEQILLSLPMQPLCREDCRGICPGCGADRNRETCSCGKPAGTGPFAALANLNLKDEP
jgi:uncharacterized protein